MPNNHRPVDSQKRRAALVRSNDGTLRPVGQGHDIGDLWGEQRRIALAEAIDKKKKQAAQRELRRQRGLVGIAKRSVLEAYTKLVVLLFGERAAAPKPKAQTPHTQLPQTTPLAARHKISRLAGFGKRRPKLLVVSVIAVLLATAVIIGAVGRNGDKPEQAAATTPSGTAPKPGVLERGTPAYDTVLPGGKTAEALGGWTRISPPNRDAVWAYTDSIGGIPISVSQQKLPADFKTSDTDEQVSQLAKDFDAQETITAASTTVYIGTSAKGPQSVIFNMNDLLILIKSTAPIAKDQWVAYINSLR